MADQRKIALFAAGGLLALLILAAVAIVPFVDVNAQKPRLEAAASEALGMEVRIVKIGMKRPRISIEQDRDGKFNFETPEEEDRKKTSGEAKGTRFSLDVTKISLSDGALDLNPVTMRLFGGQGSGSLRVDVSGSVPHYQLRYLLSGLRIEEFLMALSPKKVAEGSMDFSATLSMRGKTANEMTRTANG